MCLYCKNVFFIEKKQLFNLIFLPTRLKSCYATNIQKHAGETKNYIKTIADLQVKTINNVK